LIADALNFDPALRPDSSEMERRYKEAIEELLLKKEIQL
jgi:hypothetical protein